MRDLFDITVERDCLAFEKLIDASILDLTPAHIGKKRRFTGGLALCFRAVKPGAINYSDFAVFHLEKLTDKPYCNGMRPDDWLFIDKINLIN